MAFSHEIIPQHANGSERGRTARPSFSSQKTADRLRECERSSSKAKVSKIKPHRTSVFKEEGLDDLRRTVHVLQDGDKSPTPFPAVDDEDLKGKDVKFEVSERENEDQENGKPRSQTWYSKLAKGPRPIIKIFDGTAGFLFFDTEGGIDCVLDCCRRTWVSIWRGK